MINIDIDWFLLLYCQNYLLKDNHFNIYVVSFFFLFIYTRGSIIT